MRRNIEYYNQTDFTEINEFLSSLPHKLKMQMQLCIYESRFQKIKFFKDKQLSYIAWFSHLLKPTIKNSDEYIYYEGEDVAVMYFSLNGNIQFVLPRFDNIGYLRIDHGELFGTTDIFASTSECEIAPDDWYEHKHCLRRHSTVRAVEDCEVLTFTLNDFMLMSKEFPSYYDQLKRMSIYRTRSIIKLKLKA